MKTYYIGFVIKEELTIERISRLQEVGCHHFTLGGVNDDWSIQIQLLAEDVAQAIATGTDYILQAELTIERARLSPKDRAELTGPEAND